jgi:hypothetical protein
MVRPGIEAFDLPPALIPIGRVVARRSSAMFDARVDIVTMWNNWLDIPFPQLAPKRSGVIAFVGDQSLRTFARTTEELGNADLIHHRQRRLQTIGGSRRNGERQGQPLSVGGQMNRAALPPASAAYARPPLLPERKSRPETIAPSPIYAARLMWTARSARCVPTSRRSASAPASDGRSNRRPSREANRTSDNPDASDTRSHGWFASRDGACVRVTALASACRLQGQQRRDQSPLLVRQIRIVVAHATNLRKTPPRRHVNSKIGSSHCLVEGYVTDLRLILRDDTRVLVGTLAYRP